MLTHKFNNFDITNVFQKKIYCNLIFLEKRSFKIISKKNFRKKHDKNNLRKNRKENEKKKNRKTKTLETGLAYFRLGPAHCLHTGWA